MPYLKSGPSTRRRAWLDSLAAVRSDSDTLSGDIGLTADAFGDKWVYPGVVLDYVDAGTYTGKLMVRASGSTYTAKGIMMGTEPVNMKLGDKLVGYYTHARVREDLVECEGSLGSVAAGVKTSLANIEWI